jgi:hypothetical protein
MSRIRVALGDVHSPMLRDILAQITHSQRDMELLGALPQTRLKEAISENKPDVVICDIRPEELPLVCGELFSEPDPPVVVGLARDGREAVVCIPNAGAAQLMSVIRSATTEETESKVVELSRPPDADRDVEATDPYASNSECLDDQLRCLDLALLLELEAFEATVWEEGTQRLQGLAVSPDEVRSMLLHPPVATMQRPAGELRRRRARLQEWTARRVAASFGRADAPPFVQLSERFSLRPFEQFCIAATLALEVDRNKYGKAYALLQDDVTRKQPSFELFLRLWTGLDERGNPEIRQAFDTSRPLRRWNLLHLATRDATEPSALFGCRIELDDRIARFLLGLEDLGPQLKEVASLAGWDPSVLEIAPEPVIQDRAEALIAESLAPGGSVSRLVVQVHGPYGSGRRSLIAGVCGRHGLRLIHVDTARLVALPSSTFDETVLLLARESLLGPASVCHDNVDRLVSGDDAQTSTLATIVETLRNTVPIVFVLTRRPWLPETIVRGGAAHSIGLGLPDAAAAKRLWAAQLSNIALEPRTGGTESVARELASRFALSPGQIRDAAATAGLHVRLTGRPTLTIADLYRGCRDQCSHALASLARHVTTSFGWSDLIVPVTQANQLRELETAIRNASGVLEDWNFGSRLPYGRGITALFSGPSGTGKTMAAGILARELGLDLYQIDLSRVVSKYIGETERNLDRIFEEAQASNAMLFFDEADALFGKRSTIKDAHDRYANIEVSYLLQKMEVREGVTILATNLRANLDEAFLRRIRFVIEFPTPEQHQRLQIWRGSLPKEARLAPNVDLAVLARRYRLTGGSIVNICLSAASLAYGPGGAIDMKHLLHATKRELQKLGEQYREEDFSPELTVLVGGRGRNGA